MTPWIRIRKNPRTTCAWEVFMFQQGIGWQLVAAHWSWPRAMETARRAIWNHRGHLPPGTALLGPHRATSAHSDPS